MSDERFVIVGASLAGAKAAEGLRAEGFEGEVVLIGSEEELPYERPPLSKDYLRGEAEDKPFVHDKDWYSEHNVDLRLGTDVTAIDTEGRTVTLDDGSELGWNKLLLATGSEPRRLNIEGAELEGVYYLRTLADSEAIAARLEEQPRVVVIGSGWIGCEAAASAREKGCEVTVLTPDHVPLLAVLGDEIGEVYRDIHISKGVVFRGGQTPARIAGIGKVELVITQSGKEIPADIVIIGIGAVPRVKLAEEAGLAVGNGVKVDANLLTSSADVYAAGDIASVDHPFYGNRVRVEHWGNALAQGTQAASSMLGNDTADANEVPYFFSDQYDVGMEYRGLLGDWDELVIRGDTNSREFIAFWLRDKQLQVGMNVNIWDVNETFRDLILSRKRLDSEALADPEVPLESLL